MINNTLTALNGVKVGHATHLDKLTGCTFVMFDRDLPVAYKAYGGGCATYNTDMLRNGMAYYRRHGLFIAGGSMTGLMSATEIKKMMINNGLGFRDANIINPSISGAIVFDLGTRIAQFDPIYGREAFENLSSEPVRNGNVGAGTGTTVGKFQYVQNNTEIAAMKSGVGSAKKVLDNGITIAALSVVNAVGNVVNPDGSILAGNRDEKKKFKTFEETIDVMTHDKSNTTITIVGINVALGTRERYERVAHLASHGQVRAINPVNMSVDGDTVFVFSTEEIKKPLNEYGQAFQNEEWEDFTSDMIGHIAAKVVQESIYNACHEAESITFKTAYGGIIPSIHDYQ